VAKPDYGPEEPSKGAGITVCGATPYVLNYNLILDTSDMEIAREISKLIRATSADGMTGVEAMAYLKGTSQQGQYLAEVACNLKEPLSIRGSTKAVLDKVTGRCL
jgi:glutamate formiminotransferase